MKPFRSKICDWVESFVGDLEEPSLWQLSLEIHKTPATFFCMILQLRDELELHLGIDPTAGNYDSRLCPECLQEQLLDRLCGCAQCLLRAWQYDFSGVISEFDPEFLESFIRDVWEFRRSPSSTHSTEINDSGFQLYVEATGFLARLLETPEDQKPRNERQVEDKGIAGGGKQRVHRPISDPKQPTKAQIQLLKDRIAKVTGNESFHIDQMSKTNITSVRRRCGMNTTTATKIWNMLLEQAKVS